MKPPVELPMRTGQRAPTHKCRAALAAIALSIVTHTVASAQVIPPPRLGTDSVTVQPSKKYGASGVHSFLLGDNYRDLWAKPVKVPVLNLATYAGGLKGTEEGGNAQTRNLRLLGADGKEYVFRPIFKEVLQIDDELKNTLLEDIFSDGLSASHPAATVIPSPLLTAAGVIHATPVLYVMPDDERLGEFRHFAGKLGTLEEFPGDPDDGKNGWFGAVDVIDSEDILEKINEDGSNRIDAHALLTARLVDLLIGDNDRHPGQFKWLRRSNDDKELWVPIPRDRDKAFVSYEGFLLKMARLALPRLVTYRNVPQTASFYNAVDFDRRLLVSLDRADFDSTAKFLQSVITDAVIDSAVKLMPKEWHTMKPQLGSRIKARRNNLAKSADGYYRGLFTIVDLHGSDAADRATIVRQSDGSIDLKLETKGVAFLDRKFSPDDTREIRLYLHAGDDSATVTGESPRSIPLWIVGGSGANVLADESAVGGKAKPTRMYDNGGTPDVKPNVIVAGGDVNLPNADSGSNGKAKNDSTEKKTEGGYDADTAWNRRPMVKMQGYELPPFRDRGASLRPTLSISTGRGLGVMPVIEFTRRKYGFRQFPYASRAELEVGYSTALKAWEVELETDNRFESSRMFIATETGLSQLLTGRFGGFGNDLPQPEDRTILDVKMKQFYFQPSLGWAFTPYTDFTMGPVVKLTTTDSIPDRVVSELQPYGFRRFGQAGFAVKLLHESDRKIVKHGGTADELLARDPRHVFQFDATAAVYPAVWDARTTFGTVSAMALSKLTLPLPLSPVFATRIGGQQNFGDAPYFESAFLGGRQSVRTLHRQAYAGDAMLYGTVELRVPIAKFPLILPLNTGVFGFADAGRVYVDGESPGGWHTGTGGGVWLGVLKTTTSISLTFTNSRDRKVMVGTGFVF